MNVFSNKWSSEMDIEAYSLIHQYYLNTSLVGDVSQSLDLTNTCYYNFDASCNEDLAEETKLPSKILKTTYISPNIHLFSSSSSSTPPLQNLQPSSIILSFENSGSKSMNQSSSNLIFSTKEEEDESLKMMMTPRGTKRTSFTRSQSNPQDHILAERKRREKLTQRFVALSALIPGLKKADKATVLEDAIKHLKQLQERVKKLEEDRIGTKKMDQSIILIKRSQVYVEDHDSNTSCSASTCSSLDKEVSILKQTMPMIEARVSDKDLLIRIHCENKKGCLVKVLTSLEMFSLEVVNSFALPFGKSTLVITILSKMDNKFCGPIEDVVKNIRLALDE
ncbi:unnamed protein product [Cochlearia groenlandica]